MVSQVRVLVFQKCVIGRGLLQIETHEAGGMFGFVWVLAIMSFSLITALVLQTIKESQQQHGLRHGDFQRYRSVSCASRLMFTFKVSL